MDAANSWTSAARWDLARPLYEDIWTWVERHRDDVGADELGLAVARGMLVEPCEIEEVVAATLHRAEVLAGSPPNVLSVAACPDGLRDAVLDAVRAAAQRQVADAGTTFDDLRRHVLRTLGDPWGYAGEPRPEGHEQVVPQRDGDAYSAWLAAVCDDDNFAANVMQLPQAWDGSLNYQAAAGNLDRGVFDIGPFLLVYSDLGRTPALGPDPV